MLRTRARTNRNGWIAVVVAVMLLFGLGSMVTAQRDQQGNQDENRQQSSQQNQQSDKASAQMQNHVLANDLIGTSIHSQQGEELGKLEDVVFDEQHKEVAYIVMSSGGFLGIGGDRHALSWDLVTPDLSQDRITIPISKDVLNDKEGFGDQWPRAKNDPNVLSMADASQSMSSQTMNGQSSQSSQSMNGQSQSGSMSGGESSEEAFEMRKASNMIGMDVQFSSSRTGTSDMTDPSRRTEETRQPGDEQSGVYGDAEADADADADADRNGDIDVDVDASVRTNGDQEYGENAGQIDDLLLSNEGRLEMALIQPNSDYFENIEDNQLVAIPWTRMSVMPMDQMAVANLSKSDAQQLTVQDDQINRLDDNEFRRDFYSSIGEDMGASGMVLGQTNGTDRMNGANGHMNGSTNGSTNGKSQTSQSAQQDLQKWSSFAMQCLGDDLDKSDETIEGTIHNVGTMYTGQQAEAPDGLRFVVRTDDDERITVYAGPRDQVAQDLNFYRGDHVTIEGARCQIDNEQVVVATSIKNGNREYELTSKNGVPKWEAKNGSSQQKSDQKKQDKQDKQQGGQQERPGGR